MTGAEKYLRSLVDQNEYITNMIRRKEELIERSKTIKTVDTSVERVQTSHNTDRICDITTEIAALEQEIEEEDAKLWKSIYEFKQLMNNVHDIAYIRVLNQIYFLFHTPERAAQELNHECFYCFRLCIIQQNKHFVLSFNIWVFYKCFIMIHNYICILPSHIFPVLI